MKIQPEHLTTQLTKNIKPLYLVSGDEFLLVQEACDTIRKYTANAGYSERELLYIEKDADWEDFLRSARNSSLFSDRTLIELHFKNKPSANGSKILQSYAKHPSPDKSVLIITNKLDAAQQQTAWFKTVDACGIILQIWPLEPTQLPQWLIKRLAAAGLSTDWQGIQLLANYVAGNLLAATQEIEKLSLLYDRGNITANEISKTITDNSRFNVFNLIDATLSNNLTAASRILDRLKSEGTEPTLILWTITNELRSLIKISFAIKQGVTPDLAMTQNRIWQNRKPLVKKMLTKFELSKLQELLQTTLNIDLIIKGADHQHLLWHELQRLIGFICLNLPSVQKTPILS